MKECSMLAGLLIAVLSGCSSPGNKVPADKIEEDSSLIAVQEDTSATTVADSLALVSTDTVPLDPGLLPGKWLQTIQGPDKPVMQGFLLKRNGAMTSVNTYAVVYEKWALQRDTLLLWSRAEGMKTKDSSHVIDTAIITELTDTSLVLHPLKAAEGYLDRYERKDNENETDRRHNVIKAGKGNAND
jgi:hypothetical protein